MEYGSHSVVIHTTDTGTAVKLGGITSMGMPLGNDIVRDDSGSLYPTFGGLSFQAVSPQFTTKSIAAALAAIPQAGICINSDGTHPGVALYGESKGDCTDGEPGSGDHLEYLIESGFIAPISLSGSRRDDAVLSVEIDSTTPDGTNAPFVADPSATLPTGVDTGQFVFAAMRIGNILWDDMRNVSIDFGVQRREREPQLGGVWQDRTGRLRAEATATITARNPLKLNDSTGIPLLGATATHANTLLYLKKRKNRAAFEADGDTVHMRITMAGMVLFDNPFAASGTAPAETTVRIIGVHDGTNAPLIVSTGLAYDPSP